MPGGINPMFVVFIAGIKEAVVPEFWPLDAAESREPLS